MKTWEARLYLAGIMLLLILQPTKADLMAAYAEVGSRLPFLKVVVAQSSIPLPRCEDLDVTPEGRQCYQDYLLDLLVNDGGRTAVTRLGRLEETSPIVKEYCHPLAHELGLAALKVYGSARRALEQGGMECFSGYYHGVIEVALNSSREYESSVRQVCSEVGQSGPTFRLWQCAHSLGHGLTAFRQYNLELALRDCDTMSSQREQRACYSGVFMENILPSAGHAMGITRPGSIQDDGSDFWPCFSVGEKYRWQCLWVITTRILQKHNYDFAYSENACTGIEEKYRPTCFQSYGRDAAWYGLKTSLPVTINLCNEVADGYRDNCFYAAAATIAGNYADPRRADELCRQSEQSRAACEKGKTQVADWLQ